MGHVCTTVLHATWLYLCGSAPAAGSAGVRARRAGRTVPAHAAAPARAVHARGGAGVPGVTLCLESVLVRGAGDGCWVPKLAAGKGACGACCERQALATTLPARAAAPPVCLLSTLFRCIPQPWVALQQACQRWWAPTRSLLRNSSPAPAAPAPRHKPGGDCSDSAARRGAAPTPARPRPGMQTLAKAMSREKLPIAAALVGPGTVGKALLEQLRVEVRGTRAGGAQPPPPPARTRVGSERAARPCTAAADPQPANQV